MFLPARWHGSRQDRLAALLVLAGLAVFVVGIYATVVLGGGALIGQTTAPSIGLSVVATAIVALAFESVQLRLERAASHLVHGGRRSPYDVLSRFSETVAGSSRLQEIPGRMARVLAEGTGAQWAQVWLLVNERPVLAATWPPDEPSATVHQLGEPDSDLERPRQRTAPVRLGDEQLGVLRLQEREDRPLTPVEERLFAGLAAQAGLVLHGARLRVELAERAAELSARAEELRLSRLRLVDTQDAERRRLERDIHDGAQQHLVALAVNLRLAQTLSTRSPERAAEVLTEQVAATERAIETLVSLSRGIYPRTLSDEGIGSALRAAAGTNPVRTDVHDTSRGRYSPEVETAVYFCCLEAMQNAAKHADASRILVDVSDDDGRLVLRVDDDGHGFDPSTVAAGEGIANMRDRLDTVGGELTLTTSPDGGTRVIASVPLTGPAAVAPAKVPPRGIPATR